jgi:hypothetical protein
MLRYSIFALSAAAVLSATALAPTEALAFRHSGGVSPQFTTFHPVLHPPIVLAGVNQTIFKHPPCFICLHPPGWGGPPPPPPPPPHPHPGNGGYVAAFGDVGSGSSTPEDCVVVRKRTPSGKIVEICSNWAAE